MRRISKRLLSSGIIDIVAGAIPGIRDILVLGKVKQIERSGIADLVLVDAPATGHTMTFLSSAGGLLDAARGGPIRSQAADVVGPAVRPGPLPGGPGHPARGDAGQRGRSRPPTSSRTRWASPSARSSSTAAIPPSTAWTTPAAEAAADAGVTLEPDLVDALEQARRFRRTRQELQEEQLARLAHELPLPQLRVPFLFTAAIGPGELDVLSAALAAGVEALHDPAPVAP